MRIKSSTKSYSPMNFTVGLFRICKYSTFYSSKLCIKRIILKVVFIKNQNCLILQISDEMSVQVIVAFDFKVVVRACCGAYSVAHVFQCLAPNSVSRRPA